jgi:hypothetical protein
MGNGWFTGIGLLAMIATGCSGKYTPVKVEGVVTLDGKPVEGVTIHFLAAKEGKEGRQAFATSDKSGAFRLNTLGREDGALPGDYKVVVFKYVPVNPNLKIPDFPKTPEGKAQRDDYLYKIYGDKPRTKNILPATYSDIGTTPFHLKVPTKGKVVLELKSK